MPFIVPSHRTPFSNLIYSKEEDEMLRSLPETVHPVRRAEVAYSLLEKTEEFVQYYEQNRFGEMKIGGDGKDATKSALSALAGDDISIGSDRTFFTKTLPQLCAAIVGFCAVESALELSNFSDEIEGLEEEKGSTHGLKPSRFRESSERYERTLLCELGHVLRNRCDRANLGELARTSRLLVGFRAALKIVHPSSTARRVDKEMLNLDTEMLQNCIRIAQDEQLKATMAIVDDDQMVPMLVAEALSSSSSTPKTSPGVPDPEDVGVPFGLSAMKQVPQKSELDFQEHARTSYNQAPLDEVFTFSHSVPVILRAIHARAITCAAFALGQYELCQKFPDKRGSPVAAFVFDCIEECVGAAVIGMKDNDNVMGEGSVEKAVQVMANISALQHSLPRLFGTVLRGSFHIGLVRADEVDETFAYAEKSLKAADKACDAQVGSTYSMVYEICRTKIDSHINISLENFNWVAKSARDSPNPYCESLIGYLKTVFAALGPMDEGSRAGLHFSCCGHVSERLVKLLSAKPGDATAIDDSTLPPLTKIDAFGLRNLFTDCEEFERFAENTGIPSLRDCFSELRILTSIMLDKELPTLLLPEQAAVRRRKYPILSMDKVVRVKLGCSICMRWFSALFTHNNSLALAGKYSRKICWNRNGSYFDCLLVHLEIEKSNPLTQNLCCNLVSSLVGPPPVGIRICSFWTRRRLGNCSKLFVHNRNSHLLDKVLWP
jgi:exocyst complex component 6